MITASVIMIITDKNREDLGLFEEIKRLYNSVSLAAEKFEFILVNSCDDDKFNNDVNILGMNLNYCIVKHSSSSSVFECLQLALSSTSYENIVILNNDVNSHPIDLDYVLINYSVMKENCCFAMFESNNSQQSEICGIVVKSFDLRQVIRFKYAKSTTEFLIQLCMLYYYIGRIYRINNRISFFRLFKATIDVRGLSKLRMYRFLGHCRKVYYAKITKEPKMPSFPVD